MTALGQPRHFGRGFGFPLLTRKRPTRCVALSDATGQTCRLGRDTFRPRIAAGMTPWGRVAVLVHPNNPVTEPLVTELQAAASSIGGQIEVLTLPPGSCPTSEWSLRFSPAEASISLGTWCPSDRQHSLASSLGGRPRSLRHYWQVRLPIALASSRRWLSDRTELPVWPFRKKVPQSPRAVFSDPEALFRLQCKYGQVEIQPGTAI